MECRDVRPLADPYLSEQLLVETTQAIVAHLERCPACRAEFEGVRRLKLSAKGAFERSPSLQIRPEFLTALTADLQRSSSPRDRSRWRRFLPLAAGVLLAAGLGSGVVTFLPDRALAELAHLAAGDHQNCALKFKLAERPVTLADGATRFDPAFGRLESVDLSTALSQGRVRVAERHACVYDGQPFAHIVVIYKDTPVSLLIANNGGTGTNWWRRAGARVLSTDGDFQMASFRSGGHSVFVVSTLPKADVEEIAQSASGPLTRALTGA